MQQNNVAHALAQYRAAQFSFFNTLSSEKKILQRWTEYQNRKPTEAEIAKWLTLRTQNYAIVCGEISNIIVYDVDTKNGGDPAPFLNRGLPTVRTPSGGYHFYTKYDPILKSTKHKKAQHDGILKAVDVQSNGAVVFAYPSVFPQGAYTSVFEVGNCFKEGEVIEMPPLPDDLLASVLDAMEPEKESKNFTPFVPKQDPASSRPGDIFNAVFSWDQILIPRGWKKIGNARKDGVQYWRRPDKRNPNEGISASTNWRGYDLFFPYTTHYPELEQMRGYTRFSFITHMEHGGDPKKAAMAIVRDNRAEIESDEFKERYNKTHSESVNREKNAALLTKKYGVI